MNREYKFMQTFSLSSEWTKEENEAYEKALASLESELHLTNDEDLEKILRQIPGKKTLAELKEHRQKLVDDIANIVSGKVPLPSYMDDKKMKMKMKMKKKKPKPKMDSEWHCSKGEPWTVLEHKLFLAGLEKFGKGSWKSISRLLKTRSSSQVASHAQKYFARLKREEEKKKILVLVIKM
ncbi:transcription factor SRM1-like [Amaranthus tricolor]|uniref:transcription factor SRM1-like n=1 Tax=Amaranthus tricolor TaxID=29722 RepID=UPI002584A07E|nr:transcription factor SRM1-like [Amaranthus tricolor]